TGSLVPSQPHVSLVFPPVVETQQQSLMLVKRLLAVAISSITYLRGLFPERAYGTKYVEVDHNIVSKLRISFLKEILYFCFQVITECYQFRFKYTEEGPVVNFGRVTSADTKKACILLIRKLYVLMQNLGPLPSEISLTMKLFYYDEVTPQDYQPPGFKEGENDDMVFEGIPVQLMVGDVSTPFHTVKLKITTESNRLENVMHSDLNTNESKHMMEPDKEEEFSTQDSNISIRQVR
uniref:HORMA domain containing 1 n=1 Tax=Erpetoichthys calabaricus TaxID=27687 RepID=A0A8C4REM5_ERPCA